MKKLKLIILLIAVSLLVFFAYIYLCIHSGVVVRIHNIGLSRLSLIKVEYTGGFFEIGRLEPQEMTSRRVNPTSESHLLIKFEDISNRYREQRIDVYFEKGYSGYIDIYIDNEGKVSWRDKIKY